MTTTGEISGNGVTNTVTYQDFDCFGETRHRTVRIEAAVVRRRTAVVRSRHSALCMMRQDGSGDDHYPEHTEGGHLIGLCLGGVDSGYNLVPMFAGFNQVTWKAIETRIYNDASIVRMKVQVSYTAAEPRKPAQFWVYVQRAGSAAWILYEMPHMMDQPQAYAYAIPEPVRARLAAAQAEMEESGWTAESAGLDARFLPDPSFRRYAVLDFLLFNGRLPELVADLGLDYHFFFVAKGMDFCPLQRELILRVNYIRNDGVRSDVHGTLLLQGSSTHAAHIDHMVSKTVSSGYNAFSNASVLSVTENTSKGAKHHLHESLGEGEGSGGGRKRARAASSADPFY